jgi:hypothetical protein
MKGHCMDHVTADRRLRLSAQSVEILLDLVEIKLSAMDAEDRDVRMIGSLRRCRDELKLIEDAAHAVAAKRGPGRPARHIYHEAAASGFTTRTSVASSG